MTNIKQMKHKQKKIPSFYLQKTTILFIYIQLIFELTKHASLH